MSDDEQPKWEPPPILRTDRCDKRGCQAAALVRIMTRAGDLLYCGHHYHEDRAELAKVAVYILDTRQFEPVVDVLKPLDEDGRMWPNEDGTPSKGWRHADLCRWCAGRVTVRRYQKRSKYVGGPRWGFYVCEHCDETAADFSDWAIDPSAA